ASGTPVPFSGTAGSGSVPLEPRQAFDPLGGFGRHPHGPVSESLTDGADVSDEVADRAPDAPPPQPVQSAVAEGRDVSLDGRPAQAGYLGGFRPRQAAMQKPHDEHLPADMRLRVGIPFRV